jgi:hypothetical protein
MCEVNCKVQENRSLKTMGGVFSFGDMYPIIRPIRPGVSNSTQHWLCEAWTRRARLRPDCACPLTSRRLSRVEVRWVGRAKFKAKVLLTGNHHRVAFRRQIFAVVMFFWAVPCRCGTVPYLGLRPDLRGETSQNGAIDETDKAELSIT